MIPSVQGHADTDNIVHVELLLGVRLCAIVLLYEGGLG